MLTTWRVASAMSDALTFWWTLANMSMVSVRKVCKFRWSASGRSRNSSARRWIFATSPSIGMRSVDSIIYNVHVNVRSQSRSKRTHLKRKLDPPALLRLHCLPHPQQPDHRIPLLTHRPVRALIMPQDVSRGPLDRARLLVAARLSDGVAQSLREARDYGRVVASEIVELDRLRCTVVLLRVLRSAHEDLRVVLLAIIELEEGCALFNKPALCSALAKTGYDECRGYIQNACHQGGTLRRALPKQHRCSREQ